MNNNQQKQATGAFPYIEPSGVFNLVGIRARSLLRHNQNEADRFKRNNRIILQRSKSELKGIDFLIQKEQMERKAEQSFNELLSQEKTQINALQVSKKRIDNIFMKKHIVCKIKGKYLPIINNRKDTNLQDDAAVAATETKKQTPPTSYDNLTNHEQHRKSFRDTVLQNKSDARHASPKVLLSSSVATSASSSKRPSSNTKMPIIPFIPFIPKRRLFKGNRMSMDANICSSVLDTITQSQNIQRTLCKYKSAIHIRRTSMMQFGLLSTSLHLPVDNINEIDNYLINHQRSLKRDSSLMVSS